MAVVKRKKQTIKLRKLKKKKKKKKKLKKIMIPVLTSTKNLKRLFPGNRARKRWKKSKRNKSSLRKKRNSERRKKNLNVNKSRRL